MTTTFAEVFAFLGGQSDRRTPINGVSSSTAPKSMTLSFMTRWDQTCATTVAENPETLFIIPAEATVNVGSSNCVQVPKPRLAYALVVRDLIQDFIPASIAGTAVIAENAVLGKNVSVGHFSVVEDGVEIGDGSVIDAHVVLKAGVRIGRNSRIGSHTSIGGSGFGFEVDDKGAPVRIGHIGGVEIGDSVEIGHQVSIAQGTIEPTRISDHVKIDDCVFIAHNVEIGEGSYIIAGAEISGSVVIGRRVWISPEVTVINKVRIGDDALVGIGAVVVKDVEENTVVAGVPAKPRGLRHSE